MATINTTTTTLDTAQSNVAIGTTITASDLQKTISMLNTLASHTHDITDTYATNCECDCACRCDCAGNGCDVY